MDSNQTSLLIVLSVSILLIQFLILFRRRTVCLVPFQPEGFRLRPDWLLWFRTIRLIVLSSWLRILFCMLLGIILGTVSYVILWQFRPVYTSQAWIEVTPPNSDPLKGSYSMPDDETINRISLTKAAMIKSEAFLSEVVNLDKIRETQWFREHANITGRKSLDILRTRAIHKLQRNLRAYVPEWRKNGIILEMRCFGNTGRDESTRILNLILEQFQVQQDQQAKADLSRRIVWMNAQKANIHSQLDTANSQLQSILNGTSFPDLMSDTDNSNLSSQLAQMELRQIDLDDQMALINRKIELLKQQSSTNSEDSPQQGTNLQLDIPKSVESEQEIILTEMNNLSTPTDSNNSPASSEPSVSSPPIISHDMVRLSNSQIKSKIGDLRQELTLLEFQRETLHKHITETMDKLRRRNSDLTQLDKAKAHRDAVERSFEKVNIALGEMENQLTDPFLSGLRSEAATVPVEPSAPLWYVHIPVGLAIGLYFGLSFACFSKIQNSRLRLLFNDIRRLGVPLLGKICHKETDDEIEGVDLFHVVRQAPYSMMSDNYHQFRIKLRQLELAANKKILLITSPAGEDGKTTVASNLASILIEEGRKVLFLDANFRKPASITIYPRPTSDNTKGYPDIGLGNYLLGQCSDPREIIRHSGIEGLDIIDSGPVPSNLAGIWGSPVMRKLLDTFRDSYDFILIDGPAMLVNDALALAALAEGTIVVFNGSRLNKGQAERILGELKQVQATVLGIVLVGVKMIKGGYFEEQYQAYQQYHTKEIRFKPSE